MTGARPSSESSVSAGGRDMAGGTLGPQGLVRVFTTVQDDGQAVVMGGGQMRGKEGPVKGKCRQ